MLEAFEYRKVAQHRLNDGAIEIEIQYQNGMGSQFDRVLLTMRLIMPYIRIGELSRRSGP